MVIINRKLKYIYFTLFTSFFWHGCNVINPPETVPTYIHVDSFHFVAPTASLRNASTAHDINNVWVYYNNNLIGNFDLPATFPIIATGAGQLELGAGMKINGLNSTLEQYPFYKIDTFSFVAQPAKIINHTPVTTFYDAVKVVKLSDFKNGFAGFSLWGGTPATTMTCIYDTALEYTPGSGVGSILLNAPNDTLSIDSSNTSFAIPQGASFIEFNYKSSVPFYIGLQVKLGNYINSTPSYLTGIYSSSTWQKFYLDVASFNAQYQGTSYILFIKAQLPRNSNNQIQQTGQLLLDNIQLVSF